MKKMFKTFDIVLFACVGALALILGFASPYLNWDVVGYIGATEALSESDPSAVHHFTYTMIQAAVSQAAFPAFSGDPYKHAVFSDPNAFFQQLPFYQIRIGYTLLVCALSLTGVSIVTATYAISVVSVVLAIMLLFGMSRMFLAPQLRIVIPLAALAFGFTNIARASTPDGLALLAIIGCSFLFLRNEVSLLVKLLPLLSFIRTDLSLFSLAMLAAIFSQRSVSRRQVGISCATTVAICVGIHAAFGHPGWQTALYVTLVQPLPYPLLHPPSVTSNLYAQVLGDGLRALPREAGFLVYVGLTVCCALVLRTSAKKVRRPGPASLAAQLASICATYIVLHFVVLPVAWERFFAGPYIMGVFALLAMVTERSKTIPPTPKNAPSGI